MELQATVLHYLENDKKRWVLLNYLKNTYTFFMNFKKVILNTHYYSVKSIRAVKICLVMVFLILRGIVFSSCFAASAYSHDLEPAVRMQKKSGVPINSKEKITVKFQDIKVRAALQLLAELMGINIVATDAVQGNITLNLNGVPWEHALEIIMATQGLAKRQVGDVLIITPLADRTKYDQQLAEQAQELLPLQTEFIQVHYAKPAELAALIKNKNNSLLSPRGQITVDPRTNILWVQDTAEKLQLIKNFLHQLDIPARQVLIEARMVLINKNFNRELGVRLGITKQSPSDNAFPAAKSVPSLTQNLNLNLPAIGKPAAMGLALSKIGADIFLDLELSALENEGLSKTIASPRLITADQQTAVIESGEEIPFQEAASSGATTTGFKKAVLSLQVTPQVTPDNKINLKLTVTQNARGRATGVAGAPPAIDTQQITTQVLVNNGQTLVLGGIYKHTQQNQATKVPFLGDIPLLGYLFKETKKIDDHQELIIFVTPKIIQEDPPKNAR